MIIDAHKNFEKIKTAALTCAKPQALIKHYKVFEAADNIKIRGSKFCQIKQ